MFMRTSEGEGGAEGAGGAGEEEVGGGEHAKDLNNKRDHIGIPRETSPAQNAPPLTPQPNSRSLRQSHNALNPKTELELEEASPASDPPEEGRLTDETRGRHKFSKPISAGPLHTYILHTILTFFCTSSYLHT